MHSLIDKTVSKKIKTIYTNHKGRFDFYIHACHVKIFIVLLHPFGVYHGHIKVPDETLSS
ncbi:MAG: hypothetical protein A3J66_01940 [Candidatus Magasanikbacteria bacterium RIFCSPHIGHO2_02_FULL_47_14]|uniref:Uncharacterized protein n=1 Tax=Candidatus Magasanikbacteria bacterium RIFCSPHIGHO2_02_FULL_47_14 TaxID=1798680 RepID=A0A1F6MAK1_9BACT|nr:MAG: hypothetical protein A3J66_01940 [Candidatus Magasanikbacteria bacterium RIFCSPHIGHO2_02_FULL_47_14]